LFPKRESHRIIYPSSPQEMNLLSLISNMIMMTPSWAA
jgi:cbb3-type cytochrome oxidase subunit 1